MRNHKARALIVLAAAACLTGCSDSAGTLSRDYRNLNNEFVDGLMMVTSEARAKQVTEKIINPYSQRIEQVDKRMDNWELNKEREDVARDTFTEESVVLLFAENKWNQKRIAIEKARLQNLLEQLKRDKPGADPRTEWPNLADLASGAKLAPALQNMQTGGKFVSLIQKFPQWKLKAETLDLQKTLEARQARFDMPK